MGWKYVIFENRSVDGTKYAFPIIFPDKMIHSSFMAMRRYMPGWRQEVVPISAGRIEHLAVTGLGGNSETLGLVAGKDDASIIESYSYAHGIL